MVKQFFLIVVFFLTSCVYTLDIQQGNIIDQKDVDKLRPDLTKNQVVFVLGNPVVNDSFSDDKWVYLYRYQNRNKNTNKSTSLTLYFKDEKLVSAEGDFEIPEQLKKK